MSLKLDELRKRLLEQQPGSDAGATETHTGVGVGEIFETAMQKAPEVTVVPKAPEPPAVTKAPEAPLESKVTVAEAVAVVAPAKPQEAEASDEAARVSSSGRDLEPEPPNARLSASPPLPSGPVGQNELAEAVGKVFEQTKAFQTRLEDLSRIFEPIDRVGSSAARAFGPLRGFQKQMAQLARSFEPMRTFHQQLAQLAQNFEPMKALEGQLSQLADSFRSHIGELIKALEPAKQLRERIEHLGADFAEATELQEQFSELYEAFQLNPASNGTHPNSLDSHSDAGR